MTNPFVYEVASTQSALARANPAIARDPYALPWYLVLGDPGSGRTTAIKSMQLTWPHGDAPLTIGIPQQLCTYWLSAEAVFIEPEAGVLGDRRDPAALKGFCDELYVKRPREPVDGILLVVSLAEIIDLDERALEEYSKRLRRYLVEAGQSFHADVPVYVVITRYDTVWGFAEVFQWVPERKGEDPWGFVLPGNTPSQAAVQAINTEIDGLVARFESFCFAKLSSEDPPEHRTRAFQHLSEAKLRQFFGVIAMASSFERAPWFRALIIGSAIPGNGDRLRAGVARFSNMGLVVNAESVARSLRPGGLPIHAFMRDIVLPEKDIVPTKVRWRDDKAIMVCGILGLVLWVITVILAIVFAVI
jgi:type VI protein secretion system component VasK